MISSFILHNKSRTIESLLTSLGFLVIIILDGNSLNKIFFFLNRTRCQISVIFFYRVNFYLVAWCLDMACNIGKILDLFIYFKQKNLFEFRTWNFDYASNEFNFTSRNKFNSIKELVHAVSGKASRKHSLKMDEVERFKYKSFNLLYRPTPQLVNNTSTRIYNSHLWTN